MKAKSVKALALTCSISLILASCGARDKKNSLEAVQKPKISVSVFDRGGFPASEGTLENNFWTKWINENSSVEASFVIIPRNDSAQKYNTLFASGSAPDLVYEYNPVIFNTLFLQKQLMPLDELIENHSTTYKEHIEKNPLIKKVSRQEDGKMYYFGRLTNVYPNRALFVRKDWMDKLGLPVPENTDELFEMAKAFTQKDPDGNGENDTYGIALAYQGADTIAQIFLANSQWNEVNGKLEYRFENLKASAEFQKRIYEAGLVDKDYISDKNGTKARQDFIKGKIGIYPGLFAWYSFFTQDYAALRENVAGAEIIAIPLPEGGFGKINPTIGNPVQMTAAVNAKAKNPEAVMKYVDFIMDPKTTMAMQYGIEDKHYKLDESGIARIIDQELYEKEVIWASTYQGLGNDVLLGINGLIEAKFDLNDPLQKHSFDLFKNINNLYLDTSRSIPGFTHSEHMPQPPGDIQVLVANLNVKEAFTKSIVSGSDYTVEQAMEDAKGMWYKGGGDKIEDWFNNWYNANKASAFMQADIYEIMEEQIAQREPIIESLEKR